MQDIIKIHNVTKYYGKFKALSSLTINVEENQIYAFIGPNGAGKSTAIRLMLGMLNPTEGYVEVLGKSPTQNNIEIFKNIGYLPGELRSYQKLTGNQVLKFFSNLRNVKEYNYINNLVKQGFVLINCYHYRNSNTVLRFTVLLDIEMIFCQISN